MIDRLKEVSLQLQEIESMENTFGYINSDDRILKRNLQEELHKLILNL